MLARSDISKIESSKPEKNERNIERPAKPRTRLNTIMNCLSFETLTLRFDTYHFSNTLDLHKLTKAYNLLVN